MDLYSTMSYTQGAQTWVTQFYLPTTPCLPWFPSRRASPPFGRYSFYRLTEVEGWVDLGGWLHTEIKYRFRELNPDTVIHPSTNRARRRVTSLIRPTPIPLPRHAATQVMYRTSYIARSDVTTEIVETWVYCGRYFLLRMNCFCLLMCT